MSYWTYSTYAVVGEHSTICKIHDIFKKAEKDTKMADKINLINTLLVKLGYANQTDIDKLLSIRGTDRVTDSRLMSTYGDFDSVRIRYGEKKDTLIFQASTKYVFDGTGNIIKEMFPDVEVYGCYWDEAILYNGGNERTVTDDTNGVVFKKYELKITDDNGNSSREFRTNDFNEFADELEHISGIKPRTDSVNELSVIMSKVKGLRCNILDIAG